MTEIKCTVSSCAFWGKGNECAAEAIEVDNNAETMNAGKADMEIGDLNQSKAGASPETMCKTFKKRG